MNKNLTNKQKYKNLKKLNKILKFIKHNKWLFFNQIKIKKKFKIIFNKKNNLKLIKE